MSCNNIEILGNPRSTNTTTNEKVSFGSLATFRYNSNRKWILTTDQNQTLTLTSVGTTSNLTTQTCIPEKGSRSSIQLQYARSPSSSSEEYSCGLTTNTEIQETIWKCENQNTTFSFRGGGRKSD